MHPRVLVTGSAGQIGSELVEVLRAKYGKDNVIAGIHETRPSETTGPTAKVDITDRDSLSRIVKENHADSIYHLGALLSAVGEKKPDLAWRVNMEGLKNVLDVAKESGVSSLFWPSSIAVFGPGAPRRMTPQSAPMTPSTMYGVTKVAGELLCNYYFAKYGLDVRILRYPGLISAKTRPGGGTTDYAVAIYYDAVEKGSYTCFVREDTVLPMMYMPDALRATVQLMEADPSRAPRHLGYNIASMSFSAGELAAEIKRRIPSFTVDYVPDFRQNVADSWPMSIDDSEARKDWGWKPAYDIRSMTDDMLKALRRTLGPSPAKG